MNKIFFIALIMLTLAGCKETETHNKEVAAGVTETNTPNTDVALQFINSYIEYLNHPHADERPDEWAAGSPYTTKSFNKHIRTLYDEAEKLDPEMGLGFDPIFDAQDYPEEGFEIESADAKTGYVIVRGKDWEDFRLAMILKQEKGNWLVDGCGVVNVPEEKRIMR